MVLDTSKHTDGNRKKSLCFLGLSLLTDLSFSQNVSVFTKILYFRTR